MDLWLRGLAHLDPLAVPLPNGTEVVTRVDRSVGERRVPQGAVGRVVAASRDEIDVLIVGVGVVRFLRKELTPRKLGQMRFAERRAASWDALQDAAVLEAVVGSRAWGLADEQSDVDRRGIFVLPFPWTSGLADPPEVLVSADSTTTFWEAGRALRQALQADPNTLELLFVQSIRAIDPMGEWILEARDAFVSSEIYGSFGRYALSQLRRLEQAQRLSEHRHRLLEWLREEPAPTLQDVVARLAALGDGLDRELRAREYVKQLYRSLYDQGLLGARDFGSLVEFARTVDAALELPRELRPKNAYNLVRLIRAAVDWLRTGRPDFEVRGELRDRLLAIKRGEVPLADVLRMAEAVTPDLEAARQETVLPARPDVQRADTLLKRIREESARRWLAKVPGAFSREAPEMIW